MGKMKIDKKAFIDKLGGPSSVEKMSPEELAEALEHEMIHQLEDDETLSEEQNETSSEEQEYPISLRMEPLELVYPGIGHAFDKRLNEQKPMPERPTLLDFFEIRFSQATRKHCLQSAHHALKTGQPEHIVLACLLHDIVLNLAKPDHGWWGAQLVEPYVDEKVAWGIRYHQALRFYPDDEVGYEYPEFYNQIFGKDYVPDPYIEEAYKYARNHKWYMEARLITLNDMYGFNKHEEISIEPFIDIIGRHFNQPKEGLGFDNSPVAHMWRTMINPERGM